MKISTSLNSYLLKTLPEDERSFSDCSISTASMGDIYIQLKALGYIKQDEDENRWMVTSYGNYALTQLFAKKLVVNKNNLY